MISFESAPAFSKGAGVVYTKPWVVELILDLAGYISTKNLAGMVAFDPSSGDGAFLCAMARRLVESCVRHNVSVETATGALRAFEIDRIAAEKAIVAVQRTLIELNVADSVAQKLARHWVQAEDFLESSLGFPIADFIIGNPPYIRSEEIPGQKAAMYRSGFSAMRGRADIYIAFYQAALMQLRPHGVCAYICADRWMLNDYGSALRKFITDEGYNVRHIIEAHDIQAFDENVSVYPAITIITREEQGPVIVSKALQGIELENREKVLESLEHPLGSNSRIRSVRFDKWFRGGEPWPCSSPEALKLLKHLESNCLPLECKATGTRIGIGVATGADRVFISPASPDIETDRILPLAIGSDLQDGVVNWSGHYLANPWDTGGLVNLDNYPRLRKFLTPHQPSLSNRYTAKKDRPENWHKTIDRVNPSLKGKDKLYISDIKNQLLPALDTGKTYPHHNLYWITSDTWDLKVLGALLMSAVGEFFIRCYSVRIRGGYFRFQAQYLRRIRVPDPKSISPQLAESLRQAFELQDVSLATKAAFEAYRISSSSERNTITSPLNYGT